MPRFYFHVRRADGDVSRDVEGQELSNLDAARHEALNTHREMLGERLLHGGSQDQQQIEIANAQGDVLAVLKSQDALFKEGQLRTFSDDVTKSAPDSSVTSTKSGPR